MGQPNWFAICRKSDNVMVSEESDDAQQRHTDAELDALGLYRTPITSKIDTMTQTFDTASRSLKVK